MSRLLFLWVALILVAGCSETSDPKELPFLLSLKVVDAVGNPVPDLEARLHVQAPGSLPGPAKPLSRVRFAVPATSDVTVTAYDLEGGLVKRLFAGVALAGLHEVVLATDEQGQPLIGTRVYRCEMVASVAGAEVFRDSLYMTLYASIDFNQRPVLGVTDSGGQLSFTDRTEFPFLYDLGPQPLVSEDGEQRGTFEFSNTVIITLVDPDTGLRLDREVVVGAGRNRATLVWDPALADSAGAPAPASNSGSRGQPPADVTDYSLGPSIPNPFN